MVRQKRNINKNNNGYNNNNTNCSSIRKRKEVGDDLVVYVQNNQIAPSVTPSEDVVIPVLIICAQVGGSLGNIRLLTKRCARELGSYNHSGKARTFCFANTLQFTMPPVLILASPQDYADFKYHHNANMKFAHKLVSHDPAGTDWTTFLDSTMRHVELKGTTERSLTAISFPRSTNTLTLSAVHPISQIIGAGITTVNINKIQVPIDVWPNSLRVLRLCDEFNYPLDNLPNSLHELHVGCYFNLPIDHLPRCLVELRIGGTEGLFDCPIDHLPASLVRLIITSNFMQPLYHLPKELRTLVVTNPEYCHPIDHLPLMLTDLELVAPVELHSLPPGIMNLRVCMDKGDSLSAVLPSLHRITRLSVTATTAHHLIVVPATVIELSVIGNCSLVNAPPRLRHLSLINRKQDFRVLDILPHLPASLGFLMLPEMFNESLDSLPGRGLQALVLGGHHPIHNLPATLTSLQFKHQHDNPKISFNQPVDALPPSLKSLIFAGYAVFNQEVSNLPTSLEVLRLCSLPERKFPVSREPLSWRCGGSAPKRTKFNQPISQLPANLRVLALGDAFTKPIIALPKVAHITHLWRASAC